MNNLPKQNFGIIVENNAKEIVQWFKSHGYDAIKFSGDGLNGNIYYVKQNKYLRYNTIEDIPSDIKLYKLEEIKNMDNQTKMEKKVIGYKLKDNCKQYEEAARKIVAGESREVYVDGVYEVSGTASAELEEAGVLDLWFEPVKEDDYKVGDWVILKSSGHSIIGSPNHIAKLLKYAEPLTETDHPNVGLYSKYCLFEGGYLYSAHQTTDYIQRKATKEEIKSHLCNLAKEKGFVDGVRYLGATYNSEQTLNWSKQEYSAKYDTLTDGLGDSIYKNGVWATIKPKEEVVSVGGKFDVTIKDGKIWHKNDDITSFIKELVDYFNQEKRFGKYLATIKDVTFSKTGCQTETTTLGDWLHVWDMYNKLNNG